MASKKCYNCPCYMPANSYQYCTNNALSTAPCYFCHGLIFFFLSLQDVINVVGGMGVLLPLLEQVCEAEQVYNGGQEISDLLGPELTSPRGPAAMLLPLNKSAGQFIFS